MSPPCATQMSPSLSYKDTCDRPAAQPDKQDHLLPLKSSLTSQLLPRRVIFRFHKLGREHIWGGIFQPNTQMFIFSKWMTLLYRKERGFFNFCSETPAPCLIFPGGS